MLDRRRWTWLRLQSFIDRWSLCVVLNDEEMFAPRVDEPQERVDHSLPGEVSRELWRANRRSCPAFCPANECRLGRSAAPEIVTRLRELQMFSSEHASLIGEAPSILGCQQSTPGNAGAFFRALPTTRSATN